jgi:small subunit ribosomal protein S18
VSEDTREERNGGSEGGGGDRGGRRRFIRKPRVCQFCAEKTKSIDHKAVDVLKRYVTEQGRIRTRRDSGTCARHQRMLARAIKRSRHLALIPFRAERFR